MSTIDDAKCVYVMTSDGVDPDFSAANPVVQGRDRRVFPSFFSGGPSRCCSMYCFTISSGAPPQDAAK